jgi:VIT1/CCC1 family predicted Fe2+/Mn2+ transporter
VIVGQEKPSIEEALAHYGVKGMKWGVRKKSTRISSDHEEILKKHGKDVVKGLLFTGISVGVTALINPAAVPFALMGAKTAAITTVAVSGAQAANDILETNGKKSIRLKKKR